MKVAPLHTTTTTTKDDDKVVVDDKTRWIPSNMAHPWDVAVVYDSLDMTFCGHKIRWEPVVLPLYTCPICNSKVVVVGDPLQSLDSASADRKVLFKYNKQIFRLSIQQQQPSKLKQLSWWWWWDRTGKTCTAQDRIAYALGMNAKLGMKVLCKGKVLHPNPKCTPMEVSNQLLDVSQRDWEQKKVSLVVMGTRKGQGLCEPPRQQQGLFLYAIITIGISLVLKMVSMVSATVRLLYSRVIRHLLPRSDDHDGDEQERRDD